MGIIQKVMQMSQNPMISKNPIAKNTFDMLNKNDEKGLEQLATNLCKEKGIDIEKMKNDIKKMM